MRNLKNVRDNSYRCLAHVVSYPTKIEKYAYARKVQLYTNQEISNFLQRSYLAKTINFISRRVVSDSELMKKSRSISPQNY